MPLYDFSCSCGQVYEALVKDAEAKPKCPRCLTSGTSVLLPSYAPNVVFRGSGFYCTDFKGSRNQ